MTPADLPANSESASVELRKALPISARLIAALPDLLLGLMFAYPAINLASGYQFEQWLAARIPGWTGIDTQMLLLIAALEVVLLWPQLTVVDLATRVLKRPNPFVVVVVALIGGAWLLGFFEERLPEFDQSHFTAVSLPILWALWQRVQMLWTLPGKPRLERQRVRAIMVGRFNIAFAVAAPVAVYELGLSVLSIATGSDWGSSTLTQFHPVPYIVVSLYFLLASFDQWRVGGAAFAQRPRPFLWWDFIDVTRTDGGI